MELIKLPNQNKNLNELKQILKLYHMESIKMSKENNKTSNLIKIQTN